MPYTVELATDGRYVRMHHSGVVTQSILQKCRDEAQFFIDLLGCNRLLLDLRQVSNALATLSHHVFQPARSRQFPDDMAIAVLLPDNHADRVKPESVAAKTGVNLRLFSEQDGAVSWLNAD